MARPSKRTQEAQDTILQAVRTGSDRRSAAAYARMSYETMRRWLVEDDAFRASVEQAEGSIGVRLGATMFRLAFGGPAEWDDAGNQVRPYQAPNLEALKWLATHHPQLREQWGDTLRVDLGTMVRTAAASAGLPEDEVFAEVDAILAQSPE